MRIEATTRNWRREDRVERWREEFGRLVVKADVTAVGPRPQDFAVDASLTAGRDLSLGRIFHDAARTGRSRRLVRDGADDLTLLMVRSGSFAYRTDAISGVLGPGESMIFSHTVASEGVWRRVDALMLLVPRALAVEVFDPERRSGEKLAVHSEAAALLRPYAEAVWKLGRLPAPAEAHLGELLRLALTPEPAGVQAPGVAEAVGAARLERLQSLIADRAADPGLTIESLARRLGLSARTAQRVFAQAHTSFSDELTRARLEAAFDQLRAPGAELQQIGAIAYAVGFGDLSRFNRAFRARYGRTPSEARAEALAARLGETRRG